ncbi:thiopeptide-type bacteriocin biosynthesis domain-containing protein [Pseudobutyrivibrio sp. UC1225]|uniref:lantibiotic dehydratase n=1 Tax=Pseudobutyrivibrio sp. UC1225 TaxID=1798185 RepID=UPI0008E6EDB6|nr:lantibiotic dehydratase [Pseudobutyrivibrio sp. UC1225]SFO05934.1 thiopeptide-type bacteriocin biosynthesis domain-containing protein [Pseudobutyrivibrio sp. UC1225]
MKKIYNCEKNYIYRTPLSPAEMKETDEGLLELCSDKKFLEKVRIASRGLYESMCLLVKEPETFSKKARRDVLTSVYKYYARATRRTTPFGLFAGVGVGSFEKEGSLADVQHTSEKHILPDAKWLYGYVEQLEREYTKKLAWKITGAAAHDGNRITLIYTNEDSADEKSIRSTRVFEIVENYATEYTPYETLVKAIRDIYIDVGDEVIDRYLMELVENHILVSVLRPTLEERKPMHYLLETCKKYGVGDVNALEDIVSGYEEYEDTDIGEGIDIYEELQEKMHHLYDSDECLQVDTILQDNGVVLGYDMKTQIEDLANFFAALSAKCSIDHRVLEQYRNRFLEKYGMDREVPVLEMMDATIGLGAPYGYTNPTDYQTVNNISSTTDEAVRKYLTMLYENAIENGKEIRLDDSGLIELLGDVEPNKTFDSFDLYFNLTEQDGTYRLEYNGSGGSPIGGSTLGRFSIHDSRIREMLTNIQDRVEREGEKSCEIQFLPADTRHGNVCRSCTGRDYVMGPWVQQDKEIRVEDIVVGVWNNRFYAKHIKTGEIIRFGSSNMFNKMLYPNVYRFLLEIHNDDAYTWFDYPWNRLFKDCNHIPALFYKDICVTRECWNLSAQQMGQPLKGLTEEKFAEVYKEYAVKHHIPTKIRLVQTDNKIQLDTSNPWGMKTLYDIFKKNPLSSLTIETSGHEEIAMGDGKHTMEIIANITKREKLMAPISIPEKEVLARETYLKTPLQQWLYFKVYCKQSREEEMITMELKEFAKKLEEERGISHFFMRYVDVRTHLRIRFGGQSENLYRAMPEILAWFNRLMAQNLVGDYSIGIYEQETERYGGTDLIPYAEQLFVADSSVVENLLLLRRMGRTKLDAFTLTVISVLKYTQEFFDTVDEQLDFLEQFHVATHLGAFKKDKNEMLKLCDIEQNWQGLRSGENAAVMPVIDMRNHAIYQYREQLEKLGYEKKKEILYSVLHLHCNRMMGIDREAEAKAMCYAEGILHAKKYQLTQAQEEIA